jgi:hypothetical protein
LNEFVMQLSAGRIWNAGKFLNSFVLFCTLRKTTQNHSLSFFKSTIFFKFLKKIASLVQKNYYQKSIGDDKPLRITPAVSCSGMCPDDHELYYVFLLFYIDGLIVIPCPSEHLLHRIQRNWF